MASDILVIVTEKNFEEVVKRSTLPVVLDFWADWCPPCKRVAPTFEELALEFKGKIRFGKVNVDENGHIAASFGIQSIPTFVVMKNGSEVHRFMGASDKEDLKSHLTPYAD